jgi:hypothetical protein
MAIKKRAIMLLYFFEVFNKVKEDSKADYAGYY